MECRQEKGSSGSFKVVKCQQERKASLKPCLARILRGRVSVSSAHPDRHGDKTSWKRRVKCTWIPNSLPITGAAAVVVIHMSTCCLVIVGFSAQASRCNYSPSNPVLFKHGGAGVTPPFLYSDELCSNTTPCVFIWRVALSPSVHGAWILHRDFWLQIFTFLDEPRV